MNDRESLFDARRIAEIRELVTRWMALPDPQVGRLPAGLTYPIPASPDDVLWLCDLVGTMHGLLVAADGEISHALHRGSLASEAFEIGCLIASIRAVTG